MGEALGIVGTIVGLAVFFSGVAWVACLVLGMDPKEFLKGQSEIE